MCKCCEEINQLHSLTRTDMDYEYTVRISRDSYKNKLYRGTVLSERHDLNYCPECGKKLGE